MWKCGSSFPLVNQLTTTFGAIYSLAVTKKYVIVGKDKERVSEREREGGVEGRRKYREIRRGRSTLWILLMLCFLSIAGTHNQNIQVYDGANLGHIGTLTGHIGIVTALRVTESPAGVYMFSGSSDSIVQVWNLENMLPIHALQTHEKAVYSMVIPLFTGSEDQEIKVGIYRRPRFSQLR